MREMSAQQGDRQCAFGRSWQWGEEEKEKLAKLRQAKFEQLSPPTTTSGGPRSWAVAAEQVFFQIPQDGFGHGLCHH
jgi:hypothetical protein